MSEFIFVSILSNNQMLEYIIKILLLLVLNSILFESKLRLTSLTLYILIILLIRKYIVVILYNYIYITH